MNPKIAHRWSKTNFYETIDIEKTCFLRLPVRVRMQTRQIRLSDVEYIISKTFLSTRSVVPQSDS